MATTEDNTCAIVFGILGIGLSWFMLLSPWQTFVKITKDKSVGDLQPWPYLAILLNCMVGFAYGLVKGLPEGFPLIAANSIGMLAEIVFLCIFITYSTGRVKKLVCAILVAELLVVMAIVAAERLEEKENRAGIARWTSAICSVLMYLVGLWAQLDAMKRGNTENKPMPFVKAMIVHCIFWVMYGLFSWDLYVLVPNGIGALIGICQQVMPCICSILNGDDDEILSDDAKTPSSRMKKLKEKLLYGDDQEFLDGGVLCKD